MKKLLSIVLLMFAVLSLPLNRPALAADTASGAKISSANCAACHVFSFVVPIHWSLVTNN